MSSSSLYSLPPNKRKENLRVYTLPLPSPLAQGVGLSTEEPGGITLRAKGPISGRDAQKGRAVGMEPPPRLARARDRLMHLHGPEFETACAYIHTYIHIYVCFHYTYVYKHVCVYVSFVFTF